MSQPINDFTLFAFGIAIGICISISIASISIAVYCWYRMFTEKQ